MSSIVVTGTFFFRITTCGWLFTAEWFVIYSCNVRWKNWPGYLEHEFKFKNSLLEVGRNGCVMCIRPNEVGALQT